MGYDASVFLVFGVRVSIKDYASFARSFIKLNPALLALCERDSYDLEDDDDVLEFVDNYDVPVDGVYESVERLLLGEYAWFDNDCRYERTERLIMCFHHEHSVCRTRDVLKEVTLPSEERKNAFVSWLQKNGLPSQPCYMTVIQDG